MLRRPSLRSTVTTLAAAAVLVGGADLASYAGTGHALILGRANDAGGTTALKNTGRGPALSLNSIKSAPPLVVNSSKLVKHLNASKVGGLTSGQLNPSLIRFHLGRDGHTVSGTAHYVTTQLPAGQYQVSLSGIVDSSTDTDGYNCIAGDLDKLLSNNLTGAYVIAQSTLSTPAGAVLSQTGTATVRKHETIVLGCQIDTSSSLTTDRAITFLFRPINVTDKTGRPFNPKRSLNLR